MFTALWAARRGLAEAELLALMGGGDDAPLPQASWAPLHLAAEGGLVTRGGLLGLAHADLVKAVEDRYLPDEASRQQAHARLAAYFAQRPLGDRVVDELGWQQADAGRLRRRCGARSATSSSSSTPMCDRRPTSGACGLGSKRGAPSDRTAMVDALRPVLDDPAAYDRPPEAHRQLVWGAARLLADDGHRPESMALLEYLLTEARAAPGRADRSRRVVGAKLRAALVNLGAAQWSSGLLAPSPRHARRGGRSLCRADGDQAMLAAALGNLAMTERDLGAYDEAAAHFAEEEQICRARDDQFGLQASLGNQVQLLRSMRRLDEAIALHRRAGRGLSIARRRTGGGAGAGDEGDDARRPWRRPRGDRDSPRSSPSRHDGRAIVGASPRRC